MGLTFSSSPPRLDSLRPGNVIHCAMADLFNVTRLQRLKLSRCAAQPPKERKHSSAQPSMVTHTLCPFLSLFIIPSPLTLQSHLGLCTTAFTGWYDNFCSPSSVRDAGTWTGTSPEPRLCHFHRNLVNGLTRSFKKGIAPCSSGRGMRRSW